MKYIKLFESSNISVVNKTILNDIKNSLANSRVNLLFVSFIFSLSLIWFDYVFFNNYSITHLFLTSSSFDKMFQTYNFQKILQL